MKIEIENKVPHHFKEYWPGYYDIFSHYEETLGIPHALFLITTRKANGKPNIAFGGWSSFWGDKGGFFALITIMQKSHTYANILREKEFCINFIDYQYRENCWATVKDNTEEADEFAIGGFSEEAAQTVGCPRISESFMSLECSFESEQDVSKAGVNSLVIGRVVHAAIDKEYISGMKKYGEDGFMFYFAELFDFAKDNDGKRRYASLKPLDE